MTLQIRDEDAIAQSPLVIEINDENGDAQPVKIIQIRDANRVAKTVWQAMNATCSPFNLNAFGNSISAVNITTPATTVSVAGGSGSYTYSWGAQSGWTINSPSGATTTFRANGVIPGSTVEQTFVCTVTDTVTGLTDQASCVAKCTNLNAS